MDLVRILVKSVTGNTNDGLLGKIKQHRGKYNTDNNETTDPFSIFSSEFLILLDEIPIPKYRGSIGHIYLSKYHGGKIAIKNVPSGIKENLQSDIRATNLFGKLGSLINPNTNKIFREITKTVEKELDMHHEMESYSKLVKYIETFQKHNCKLLEPIKELCSDDNFVYLFDEGKNIESALKLSDEKRADIGKRIALVYFTFMHKHHILFGDLNEGNFLYNKTTDEITFIDYGCIVSLSQKQQNYLHNLHTSQQSLDEMKNLMNKWGGNDKVAEFSYKQALPFWKEEYKFQDLADLSSIMMNPSTSTAQLPPEITMCIRAGHQLINLLKYLKAEFVISDELSEIMN